MLNSKNFWKKKKFFFLSEDIKKAILISSVGFTILINYSILRSVKDGFIVKAIGAEALGFLKLYFVLPITFCVILLYTKLSNHLIQKYVFYIFCLIFVTIFIITFFVIFPNINCVIPSRELIEDLILSFPRLKWFIKIFSHWHYAIVYILAELWGSVMYSLFFWQLVNSIYSTEAAKSSYSIIAALCNLALPFAGFLINLFHASKEAIFTIIIIVNILSFVLYSRISNKLLSNKNEDIKKPFLKKRSLKESLKIVISSKYLWLMVILITAMGTSINLVEVFWKSNLNKLVLSEKEYILKMSNIQSYQGVLACILALISRRFFMKHSWKTISLFTPIFILITGGLFFFILTFGIKLETLLAKYFVFSTLALSLFLGIVQTILSKSIKYTLFDPAKEMAYIVLPEELKTKGKAAVDLIGGRFAKSGAGVIESFIFISIPSANFGNTQPLFFAIFMVIIFLWTKSINKLNIEYESLKQKIEEKS